MPGVLFTNALMLAGLAAVTIPVVIHLLLKRKKKRMRFSTNRFFTELDRQSTQRRKLRNLLLLSLRLLLVILLVCAFARPYLQRGEMSGASARRQQVVIVLDRSLSMQATGSDGERWRHAKEQVANILTGLRPDDRVALVGCSGHADVLSGFAPTSVITRMLNELQPNFGTSDLAKGLQQAARICAAGDLGAASTVYVVSDLQEEACRGIAASPVPNALEVKFISVGELFSPNVALSQMDLASANGIRPHLTITSFSDEPLTDSNLEISVDGKVTGSRAVKMGPGSSTNIDLVLPPLKPGWHDVAVRLRSKDALQLDNARYGALLVPEPLRALVVEPRATARSFEQETFFLSAALDPTKDTTNSQLSAFNLEQTTPEMLVGKVAETRAQTNYDMVMLPGLKYLPSGLGKALTQYVENGGGLLMFLGDGVVANRYNIELGGLLPAQLRSLDTVADVSSGWRIEEFDTNSWAFAAFRFPNSGNLRLPVFTRRYSLSPIIDSTVLGRFEDGTPLMLVRKVGRGTVVLVNTSADTSWNDWPKHKTYVPWVHGIGKMLGQKPGRYQSSETNQYVMETDFDIETEAQYKLARLSLRGPDGKETRIQADEQGRLRGAHISQPGIHSLRDETGKEVRRFAVNVPGSESNLKALRPGEVQRNLVRIEDAPKAALTAGLFGTKSNQRELASVLLFGVLVLLFTEIIVANRTLA